jgi:hypothetical protein
LRSKKVVGKKVVGQIVFIFSLWKFPFMKVMEGLRGLSSKHVALYLLKGAGNACRVLYYVRCCPTDMVGHFINQFDAELRQTFEDIVGFRVNESQWDQAALGVKVGGMGITRGNDIADAAYLASRAATHEDCIRMDAQHVWDNGQAREGTTYMFWGSGCITLLTGMIAEFLRVRRCLGFRILALTNKRYWLGNLKNLAVMR